MSFFSRYNDALFLKKKIFFFCGFYVWFDLNWSLVVSMCCLNYSFRAVGVLTGLPAPQQRKENEVKYMY